MAQYYLFLYDDPSIWATLNPDQQKQAEQKYRAFSNQPFTRQGARLAEGPGKVLRSENGTPSVSDGPYSETKEVLGGYHVIEAADYEEATRIAREHPHLQFGTIEVRQAWG